MSKRRKKVVSNVVRVGPVFNYTSACCSVRANKPPCERSASDRAENKYSESPLGTWTCSQCEKPCKVSRSRVKEKDGTDPETGTKSE